MKKLLTEWKKYLSENDSDRVAKVIIHKDNKILLLRGVSGLYDHNWDLPGGHIEIGEDDLDGAIREVKEETGLEIAAPKKVLEKGLVTYYKADLPAGEIKLSHEHSDHKLVGLDEVEEQDLSDDFKNAIKQSFL